MCFMPLLSSDCDLHADLLFVVNANSCNGADPAASGQPSQTVHVEELECPSDVSAAARQRCL
jgi:hypothetical protein